MKQKVVAPSVGESITEVSILKWHVPSGGAVKTGQVILEIESDKASVEVVADADGALEILKPEGSTVPIGALLAEIDTDKKGTASTHSSTTSSPAPAPTGARTTTAPTPERAPQAAAAPAPMLHAQLTESMIGPAAKRAAEEYGIDLRLVPATGKDGRITKGDVLDFIARGGKPAQVFAPAALGAQASAPSTAPAATPTPSVPRTLRPGERREPMSRLRKTIAKRLLSAQQNAAILTTFNEVDMAPVMALRSKHKDAFKSKHGVPLSFMSFFTRACVEALKEFPAVNAYIEGDDILYHDYQDIGIAVGTDRGLVVPIIRGAQNLDFVGIEKAMGELAVKAREGKLSIDDMTGGTFTISNGGVYGSMMSTPILNPPQSAILGMHNIVERAVVRDGQIVVRPMMYLALSYDHRIIDGKEAVTFLVRIKEALESPEEKLGWKGV